jgi:hypothetical protein
MPLNVAVEEPGAWVIGQVTRSVLVLLYLIKSSCMYRMATQPEAGKSVVSRNGGSTVFMRAAGASATEAYGNPPSPEPRTQNL